MKQFYKYRPEQLISVESIVTVHYFEYPKEYRFAGESHDFWEMVYVDRGSIFCSRDRGEEFSAEQGQLVLHRPGEFHTIRPDGEASVLILSFVCKSAVMHSFGNSLLRPDRRQTQILSEIVSEAEDTFCLSLFDPELTRMVLRDDPPPGGMQMIKLDLEKLLILFLREKTDRENVRFLHGETLDGSLAQSIADFLKEHRFEKLQLNEICKNFNYGKTYLCSAFKKQTGRTIFQYVTMLKVDEAKRLIREGTLDFSQISNRLGYDSYSYFVKTFKTNTGYLPKEYEKLIRLPNNEKSF